MRATDYDLLQRSCCCSCVDLVCYLVLFLFLILIRTKICSTSAPMTPHTTVIRASANTLLQAHDALHCLTELKYWLVHRLSVITITWLVACLSTPVLNHQLVPIRFQCSNDFHLWNCLPSPHCHCLCHLHKTWPCAPLCHT